MQESEVTYEKIYKIIYKCNDGSEKYTFMGTEADIRKAEKTIKDILHHVQGMNTKLVSFEEVDHEEKNV